MGRLRNMHGHEVELHPTHRVGRHPDAELCLGPDSPASRFHALLSWVGDGWLVRDLGSRNGTAHAGARLVAGVDVPLRLGDGLQFGGPTENWTLVDDTAPAAWATDGNVRVEARDAILVLPGDAQLVRLDPRAGWVIEQEDGPRPVDDGDVLTVAGVPWTLHLPRGVPPTGMCVPPPALSLVLRVADEHVQVEIGAAGGTRVLRPRAHHQLLLTLARERLRARRRGIPADEAGWVTVPDASAHLGISQNTGYVWWYRLREQLEQVDAAPLLERRFSGEIRVSDVVIEIEGERRLPA